MIVRDITVNGITWRASLVGRFTPYERDEFPLLFERKDPYGKRERRVSRFSPQGSRHRDVALAELSDEDLRVLFKQSQPEWTSPELGYAR